MFSEEKRQPVDDSPMPPPTQPQSTPPAQSCKARVFVTSQTFSGDLKGAGKGATGLLGADNLCQRAAKAAQLVSTRGWKAWLSQAEPLVHAFDRLQGEGPWCLLDGKTLVFASKQALRSEAPKHSIDVTEKLETLTGFAVWTATGADGRYVGDESLRVDCRGWSSASMDDQGWAGCLGTEPTDWTDCASSPYCSHDRLFRLYCFEDD